LCQIFVILPDFSHFCNSQKEQNKYEYPIKEKITAFLPEDEILHGEVLFYNCECQILSQSAVSIDFLVNVAGESESVEYSLLIDYVGDDEYNLIPESNDKRTGAEPA
jgi:hypothetical protein